MQYSTIRSLATNNTNAYSFMLLKTSYIKGENYKSSQQCSTFTAFLVWFDVQKYWVLRKKPCTNQHSVS